MQASWRNLRRFSAFLRIIYWAFQPNNQLSLQRYRRTTHTISPNESTSFRTRTFSRSSGILTFLKRRNKTINLHLTLRRKGVNSFQQFIFQIISNHEKNPPTVHRTIVRYKLYLTLACSASLNSGKVPSDISAARQAGKACRHRIVDTMIV